ncbi:hypothetical protein CN132_13610 [Sinorhizobium meliloti]|nr:hypothetical protein CN132_13610 [Sinorhizobium meliloti]
MLPGLLVIQGGSYPSCLIMEESIATIRSRARFRKVARGCIPRRAGEVTRKKALKASVGRGLCGKANEGPELQQSFCMTLQSMHEITEFCSWSLR